jgi:hypothetical protein
MFGQQVVDQHRQEQLRRWESLSPGAIFESSFSSLYLVTSKSETQVTAILLDAQARTSILAGGFCTGGERLNFGDITIQRVFPMPG